ncbi:MAG: FkbM family methyltransferase [Mesorhizobium sp.]|uniref:FkbM family methyltransferase n=1 Tax=Mesorhizobium sp. TaxID=1871066 RepID=UPI000FEA8BCC|nr:FkbM family methyltransferase [Mesorhizobium sp.]RWH84607.1 MAG: FkbM family methyltransferase [Mesorhizobium sp.]RWH86996.1 MAG: FkbM family methyltransferase [Mesorhizobium sp.]RWH93467.1 MAG: FkbM family methyltransferase [Mesorhizobium sp.]RWI03077.1 MAG: FkbM family methyltransferase [Mesorhizobium sp.]RWI05585.1 MAG: FkbM family methyltransferase [Mesorhizobium sp.]
MLNFIPPRLKSLVPGYRRRHYRRHAALIAAIATAMPRLKLGSDGNTLWLAAPDENLKLYGFATEPRNADLYDLLRPALPSALPRTHFRLVKDYATRWLYPHMRPDLRPEGYGLDRLHGFHRQHKDNLAQVPDAAQRERLMRAFRPGRGDVVIDCGPFLGFGATRIARDAPEGRIFAVEASRECHTLLKRNIEVNGAANVVPLHRGVWNKVMELDLETTFAQDNSLVAEVQPGERREKVQTLTIDGPVAEQKLDRLDMLSPTLNGAEVEGLEAASDTLKRLRPRIRAAGWYLRGGQRIADLIRPVIERAGYDVFVGPLGNVMALPRERT